MKIRKSAAIAQLKISNKELKATNPMVTIGIYLTYPDFRNWVHLKPKKRLKKVHQKQRTDYQQLRKVLKNEPFNLIEADKKFCIFFVQLLYNDIKRLQQFDFISSIHLEAIEGIDLPKPKEKKSELFFAIKARFIIQVEGYTKGKQTYENRIVLIKANSQKKAEKQLFKEFKNDAISYLNSDGRMVRWKFERFLDCYDIFIYNQKEFYSPEGVEVFSVLKERKLTPANIWKKQWKNEIQLSSKKIKKK